MTVHPILSCELRLEDDVILIRHRARQISSVLGFELQDQTRIATAASEIARNAFQYARGGLAEFRLNTGPPAKLLITIRDRGPGISDVSAILDGRCQSKTGMGLGLVGARRLMDVFEIESVPGGGTTVTLGKQIPGRAQWLAPARIAEQLTRLGPLTAVEELQQQNRELMRTLEELQVRSQELARVNQELEDTNRGVVALYAELDERAGYLQRASELKSHFLSNMSHEFRTPLNAILSLSRLLLDGVDGRLNPEQEKQVNYIQRSAQDLSDLVNDLLDLAKVEAGKITIKPQEFEVANLFGALRGMLRPMLVQSGLNLVFEEPAGIPRMFSDEGKVSQILRNFLSNALKYTERGEVRVSARLVGDQVLFAVQDTGIGIAPENLERIFDEWVQVDHPLQKKVKGTGLGLPLSRKLAELLGGKVWAESVLGQGSKFYARLPIQYGGGGEAAFLAEKTVLQPGRLPVLVVEDDRDTLFVYEKFLKDTDYQVVPATTLKQARDLWREVRPAAVVLDILLQAESAWDLLAQLKSDEGTRNIPVLVVTVVDNRLKALRVGADAFAVKPIERDWLLRKLNALTGIQPPDTALVIDDNEISRYLLSAILADEGFEVKQADGGKQGVELACAESPTVIFLDLAMPEMDGFATLQQLKSNPATARVPVIISTGKVPGPTELARLSQAAGILQKPDGPREVNRKRLRDALLAAGVCVRTHKEAQHA